MLHRVIRRFTIIFHHLHEANPLIQIFVAIELPDEVHVMLSLWVRGESVDIGQYIRANRIRIQILPGHVGQGGSF